MTESVIPPVLALLQDAGLAIGIAGYGLRDAGFADQAAEMNAALATISDVYNALVERLTQV